MSTSSSVEASEFRKRWLNMEGNNIARARVCLCVCVALPVSSRRQDVSHQRKFATVRLTNSVVSSSICNPMAFLNCSNSKVVRPNFSREYVSAATVAVSSARFPSSLESERLIKQAIGNNCYKIILRSLGPGEIMHSTETCV